MKEFHLCKLHNEVFEVAETRINTECFLPVREGVSLFSLQTFRIAQFPPCTGGCIIYMGENAWRRRVSSLYGRVYQLFSFFTAVLICFLPVREGVSANYGRVC